jgi:hypothetical protein
MLCRSSKEIEGKRFNPYLVARTGNFTDRDINFRSWKLSRSKKYGNSQSAPCRALIGDDQISWDASFPDYSPVTLTLPEKTQVRNPLGRTGIAGIGYLEKLGENHKIVFVIRDEEQILLDKNGKCLPAEIIENCRISQFLKRKGLKSQELQFGIIDSELNTGKLQKKTLY